MQLKVYKYVQLLIISVATCVGGRQVRAQTTTEPSLAAISGRLERLQNLHMTYDCTSTMTPLGSGLKSPEKNMTLQGGEQSGSAHIEFWFLGDRARYDMGSNGDAVVVGFPARELLTFRPNRVDQLIPETRAGYPFGGIRKEAKAPEYAIDVGLGLRLQYAKEWLSSADIESGKRISSTNAATEIEIIDKNKFRHVLSFDSGLGGALTKCVIYHPEQIEPLITCECSDFKPITGVIIPFHVEMVWHVEGNDHQMHVVIRKVFVVKNCELDVKGNTPDDYEMVWPLHTRVRDERVGQTLNVSSKARTLPDSEISKAVQGKKDEDEAVKREVQREIEKLPADPSQK